MRRCPQCGSRRLRPSHRREHERWVAALRVRPFRCRKCRRRFWWIDPVHRDGSGPLVPLVLVLAVAASVALYMAGLPYAGEASAPELGAEEASVLPPTGETDAHDRPSTTSRRFGGVEVLDVEDDRLRLKIPTGGPPPQWSHFFLARPPRFAVDLEGRFALDQSRPVFLNHPLVRRVRAERYREALRVEIELGPARGAEPEFEEAPDGLIVTLTSARIPTTIEK